MALALPCGARLSPGRIWWVMTAVLGSVLLTDPAQAQTVGEPLPIGGSLIYHLLVFNRVTGTSNRGIGLRFAGRLAVPVGEKTSVGFGGGSWVRVSIGECGLSDCDGYITSQSEAFVYQLYVQQYVSRRRLFVRGGVGLAETRTLLPTNAAFIAVIDRWRGAFTAGGGIDLAVARHVYITPSLDFTVLPGADRSGRELGSALAVGVAVTLH